MYPYDNDEFDDEERALNTQIKAWSISPRGYSNFVEQNPICRRRLGKDS